MLTETAQHDRFLDAVSNRHLAPNKVSPRAPSPEPRHPPRPSTVKSSPQFTERASIDDREHFWSTSDPSMLHLVRWQQGTPATQPRAGLRHSLRRTRKPATRVYRAPAQHVVSGRDVACDERVSPIDGDTITPAEDTPATCADNENTRAQCAKIYRETSDAPHVRDHTRLAMGG